MPKVAESYADLANERLNLGDLSCDENPDWPGLTAEQARWLDDVWIQEGERVAAECGPNLGAYEEQIVVRAVAR